MTLAIDSSALVLRYVAHPYRKKLIAAMEADPAWFASQLTRTELLMALHRLAGDEAAAHDLSAAARADWDAFHVIPLDDLCLATAVEIGSDFRLRTVDAIQLAAADRLPRPVSYATLDHHQIPAAVALGFELISPVAE